jgi:hypothetical protein
MSPPEVGAKYTALKAPRDKTTKAIGNHRPFRFAAEARARRALGHRSFGMRLLMLERCPENPQKPDNTSI